MRNWTNYITSEIERIAIAGIPTVGMVSVTAPYTIAVMMGAKLYTRIDPNHGGFDGALALAELAWKSTKPTRRKR